MQSTFIYLSKFAAMNNLVLLINRLMLSLAFAIRYRQLKIGRFHYNYKKATVEQNYKISCFGTPIHKLQIDNMKGPKWPKISDVVNGWPQTYWIKLHNIQFSKWVAFDGRNLLGQNLPSTLCFTICKKLCPLGRYPLNFDPCLVHLPSSFCVLIVKD
jgi:hypothetical protein